MVRTAWTTTERRPTRQIHVGDVAVGGGAPITVQSMTTTKTADAEGTLAQIYALAAAGRRPRALHLQRGGGGRGPGPHRAPLAGAHHRRHPLPPRDGPRRPGGGRAGPPPQPRQPPQGGRDQGGGRPRPRTGACPSGSGSTPDRCTPSSTAVRRGHPRGAGRVGPHGAGVLRRGRVRRRQDLGQGVVGAAHDRVLPAGLGDLRPSAAPRGDRGRPAAGRAPEGHRRHRHPAGRGDRRHHPLLAHRRPGRGGAGRPPAARGARAARAQGARPHRLPELRPGRDRRDRRRPGRPRRRWRTASLPIQVAVMGCVVNGPGEAREADLGIAAGRRRGHLFIKGKIVRVVPEDEMVDALVAEAERLVAEGVEARLAAADSGAEAEAEADRRALLEAKGEDANASETKVDLIRRRYGPARADVIARRPGADRRAQAGRPRARGPRRSGWSTGAAGRIADHAHDPAARPDAARGAGRRRGGQPPAAGAGRLHPAPGLGGVHLPPPRATGCCAASKRWSGRSSTPPDARSCCCRPSTPSSCGRSPVGPPCSGATPCRP